MDLVAKFIETLYESEIKHTIWMKNQLGQLPYKNRPTGRCTLMEQRTKGIWSMASSNLAQEAQH